MAEEDGADDAEVSDAASLEADIEAGVEWAAEGDGDDDADDADAATLEADNVVEDDEEEMRR